MVANLRLGQVRYNPRTNRYQSEFGGFLSKRDIATIMNAEKSRSEDRFRRIAAKAINGTIDRAGFESEMTRELKDTAINNALVGFGGINRLRDQPQSVQDTFWRLIESEYSQDLTRLRRFSQQFADGQLSEAQIRDRARRYAGVSTPAFSTGEKAGRQLAGVLEAKRELDVTADHCLDCPNYSTGGQYVPLDQIVPVGVACRCRGNCRCRVTYRRAQRGRGEIIDLSDRLPSL